MSNVYGPFDASEWETLLALKKMIVYETEQDIFGHHVQKDKENFAALAYRAA